MFCVYILLYGDYPALARRCLESVLLSSNRVIVPEIRIGLNAISQSTVNVLTDILSALPTDVGKIVTYAAEDHGNVKKYPMMRAMMYDLQRPFLSDWVMWFDDDSYITDPSKFWPAVSDIAVTTECPVVGSVYKPATGWNATEQANIRKQPWYGNVPLHERPTFATGGWWMANYRFLLTHEYPFTALRHNGGDVLLGELVRQQKAQIRHYNAHVAINADDKGRESKARRRGVTTPTPFNTPTPTPYVHPFKILSREVRS